MAMSVFGGIFLVQSRIFGIIFLFCFFSFSSVDGTTHVYLGDVIVNVDVGWTMCVAGVRLVGLSVGDVDACWR